MVITVSGYYHVQTSVFFRKNRSAYPSTIDSAPFTWNSPFDCVKGTLYLLKALLAMTVLL
jgi:hypothetical protein